MKPNPASVPRDIFTVAEAMDYLRISRASFYKLVREKRLPTAKLGGRTLIRRADIDALVESCIAA